MSKKECLDCGEVKSLELFYRQANRRDGRRAKCKECEQRWEKQPNEKQMTASRRRTRHLASYGISATQYENWLIRQDGVCAICRQPETEDRLLSVDHDHRCCPGKKSCGLCVRGLLCGRCNRGLGMFQDDPEIISAAKEYIGA